MTSWCRNGSGAVGVLVLMDDRDRAEAVSHLPRRWPDAGL
jgi:hypothetical protein